MNDFSLDEVNHCRRYIDLYLIKSYTLVLSTSSSAVYSKSNLGIFGERPGNFRGEASGRRSERYVEL